ncbi:MAG: hypothetical protein RMK43_12605, partial [Cyclobacteriaceae bacterium]|nr:hypothetical protein [Cyclobacteriaceae bacterium]
MNNVDIIRTSCKVFGLYFMVLTIVNLRDLLFYLTGVTFIPRNKDEIIILVGGQILQAVFNSMVAFILITKSDRITDRLITQKTGDLKLNLTKADWIELAIIIISTLTLIDSVTKFMTKMVNYVYFNDYEKAERQLFWTGQNKADVFYQVFKFITGLFFLLNARYFSKRLTQHGDKAEKRM